MGRKICVCSDTRVRQEDAQRKLLRLIGRWSTACQSAIHSHFGATTVPPKIRIGPSFVYFGCGAPNSIELKYLEKDHTFMRPDSIHDAIGQKMKKTSNIYDWKQLTEIIKSAAKSIKVIGLTNLDMHTFKDWHVRNSKIPKIKDLKVIRLEKGLKKLFFQKS